MKFEVSIVRKSEIYNTDVELTSVTTKADNPSVGEEKQMAELDLLPLHLRNNNFLPKESVELVCKWTQEQVIEWMTSMKLFSFIEYFKTQSISGAKLLEITESSLMDMGIEDPYQRKSLMVCLDELCGRPATEDDSEGSSTESSDECTSDSSEHDLREHTFTTAVKCHKCGKYITQGATRQGYQCTACGLCLHSECTKGKIQPCNSEKLEARKKSHQHMHSAGLSFGSDLSKDVPQSKHSTVPDILYVCTQEIERQSMFNPELDVIEAYKTLKSNEDVCALRWAFDSPDAFSVPVVDVEISTLCGVIKKYLRELTNPLIPIAWYKDFISAAKQSTESDGVASIGALVNQLPKHHCSTLHFLFNHFYKITENKRNVDGSAYQALAEIFCHIILRPDWSEITTLIGNTWYHVIVLRRLFSLYDNNNSECDKNSAASQDIAYGAASHIKPESLLYNHTSQYEEHLLPLDQYPWYWGEVSKEGVHEATNDVEDGSFLVRNARSHPTHGDYTLVLRQGGGNLLIKIHHRQSQYGFCADSCPFESVPALVSYYQHHSLAEYNAALNVRLRRGIARHSQYEMFRLSDPQYLLKQLKRNHTELLSLTKECDNLLEKQTRLSHDIQLLHQAQESFKELSVLFEEQIELYTHQRSKSDNNTQENNDVQRRSEQLLKDRLDSINTNKDVLGTTIQEKTGANSTLAMDINALKPELKTLSRQQDHILNALLSHGITRHDLEHILRGDPHPHSSHTSRHDTSASQHPVQSRHELPSQQCTRNDSPHTIKHDIPHLNKSNWFVNCTRAEAIEKLQNCRDGTFLIRPGSQDNPYSLSIAINGIVGHCKVLHQDGRYGFASPFILFESLESLVLHYKDHSLAHHNPQLNTKLLYPVKAEYCTDNS